MSKKAILSTLLISSALLGTTAAANAATSAVKPESKLVTVSKDGVKLYKNSKLEEAKKAKKGTVYKVDGYRDINGKHYYRVYQQDTKGKNVYKGYLLDKDTKDLKGQKPAKDARFVGVTKDDQPAWKNLYFNIKIKDYDGTKHSSNFEVKTYYEINGKKYLSLYRGDQWMGYMDGDAFKVLTPEKVAEDKQDYEVVKDYDTYNDLYFTKKGQLEVGEKVKVKNIYTFGTGRKYGSLYNEDGKWMGYANMNAVKPITSIVTSADLEGLQNAIRDAKEVVKNDSALTGIDQVKSALEAGEKVLSDAKKGNATKEQVDAATKAIEDAIKGVTVNKTDLEKEMASIRQLAGNVYLTKAQEEALTKALDEVEKVSDELSKENVDAVKKAQNILVKAKEGLEKQPTAKEGQSLVDAMKRAEQLKGIDEKYVDVLFQNVEGVKPAYDAAKDTLDALKQDPKTFGGQNTATKDLTAADVNKVTKALNDALDAIQLNKQNTEWFYKQAKQAIADLGNPVDLTNALKSFEVAAKDFHGSNYNTVLKAANTLVKAIDKEQTTRLQASIEKAKRIAGPNNENGKFYTDATFNKMTEETSEAEKIVNRTIKETTKDNCHDKQTTLKALDKAINGLKIKDWKYTEQNGQVQLISYTGNYTATDGKSTETPVIEIPGALKDRQVTVSSSAKEQLFPATEDHTNRVEVKFEKATDGKTPKVVSDFTQAFANNKKIQSVDVTGLDTKDATSMEKIFFQDYYLNEVKGSDKFVQNKVTSLKSTFVGTNVSTLDASKWNTSGVTNMQAMFKGSKLQTVTGMENWDVSNVDNFKYMFGGVHMDKVDFSGWDMAKGTEDNVNPMFFNNKYEDNGSKATVIKAVVLPNAFNGVMGNGPKLIVTALEKAGAKNQLANEVDVIASTGKGNPEHKIGSVTAEGKWVPAKGIPATDGTTQK